MNRLADEKSPYLLQHQHNPVDWFPWGEAAFAKARAENKPVFLSVGYSTCHWCHVMAGESFENAAIADVMNAGFVNVKVDREERPDVDRLYMNFVQATTGHGGWPMSVWMTPEGAPFLGGTYFPPEDRYGRRGFPSLLTAIAEAWRSDREALTTRGDQVLDALREMATRGEGGGDQRLPDTGKVLRKSYETFAAEFDPEWGGFGDAPKFPRPSVLNLLARVHARAQDADPDGVTARRTAEMLTVTLDRMAAGGMNDQLGGGFHRYSVDRFWHVPHFEKMLYDQAQLVVAYLEAFQITGDERHAETVRATLGYVSRDLTSPEGGFFCAEDADSPLPENPEEHAEGAFYVWTEAEIAAAGLTEEENRLARFRFGVEPTGNAPAGSDPQGEFTGKNILLARRSLEETAEHFGLPVHRVRTLLELAREKLFHARKVRPRPHLDDKVLTGWNGLMISAFARAYATLDELRFLRPARAAAEFVRANLHDPAAGTLLRSYRQGASNIAGFADDYAFFIQGLLDLYEADFDLEHLLWAERLQDTMDRLFFDGANGGYFSTAAAGSGDVGAVLVRLKDDHDGAEPAAGSIAAMNGLRLSTLRGRADLRERAARTLAAAGARLEQLPQAMPAMACALDAFVRSPRQVVVAGERDATDTRALLRAARRSFRPGQAVLFADGGDQQRQLAERLPFLAAVRPVDGRAAAYVCEDGTCQLPVTDPTALRAE